jgi:hypothetical protein
MTKAVLTSDFDERSTMTAKLTGDCSLAARMTNPFYCLMMPAALIHAEYELTFLIQNILSCLRRKVWEYYPQVPSYC